VYVFGSHGGLVGVVAEPDRIDRDARGPAVVFSNVGLNHRVGPNRIYVELARVLAASGFASLRFDLSGFGDSEPRRSNASDADRAIRDTREALDFLEKKGLKEFVLVGFCSSVDSVHVVAIEDPRVIGAIFIDGFAYRNFGFWLRYFTIRNLQPERWLRFVRQRLSRLRGRNRGGGANNFEVFERTYPSQQRFASDVARLVHRSVKMLFVYTVVADNWYNYRNQFHETFGYRTQIEVEYYTRSDHVFSIAAHRASLLSRVLEWMNHHFPLPTSEA
jgi:pimeloyl-ACP methyl ester carboxylesterase